jgi:hypothetical protein
MLSWSHSESLDGRNDADGMAIVSENSSAAASANVAASAHDEVERRSRLSGTTEAPLAARPL